MSHMYSRRIGELRARLDAIQEAREGEVFLPLVLPADSPILDDLAAWHPTDARGRPTTAPQDKAKCIAMFHAGKLLLLSGIARVVVVEQEADVAAKYAEIAGNPQHQHRCKGVFGDETRPDDPE